jgi:hypothetical protein
VDFGSFLLNLFAFLRQRQEVRRSIDLNWKRKRQRAKELFSVESVENERLQERLLGKIILYDAMFCLFVCTCFVCVFTIKEKKKIENWRCRVRRKRKEKRKKMERRRWRRRMGGRLECRR